MAKDIINQIREGLNSLVGTTNKAIETGRLQIDIQQMKLKISNLQKAVGKKVIEKHLNGDVIVDLSDDTFSPKLKEIEFYNEKIKELEERIKHADQD